MANFVPKCNRPDNYEDTLENFLKRATTEYRKIDVGGDEPPTQEEKQICTT